MPTQRIENAAGAFTVWGSAIALAADALQWMSENVALITAVTLLCGFMIQMVTAIYNRSRSSAEERRAQLEFASKTALREAEEKRAQEEHDLKMAILRSEVPDRRAVKERIEVVGEREGDAIG